MTRIDRGEPMFELDGVGKPKPAPSGRLKHQPPYLVFSVGVDKDSKNLGCKADCRN